MAKPCYRLGHPRRAPAHEHDLARASVSVQTDNWLEGLRSYVVGLGEIGYRWSVHMEVLCNALLVGASDVATTHEVFPWSQVSLEDALIATCLLPNPDLLNSRQTRLLREVIVPGFMKMVADANLGRPWLYPLSCAADVRRTERFREGRGSKVGRDRF